MSQVFRFGQLRLGRAGAVVLLSAVLVCTTGGSALAAPGRGNPALVSAITGVEATVTPVTVGGQEWRRITGLVSGVVDPREDVAGLAGLAKGLYRYSSVPFEVITPATTSRRSVVLVEPPNRGLRLLLPVLQPQSPVPLPALGVPAEGLNLGDGALATAGLSYASVQWQTGIAPGVPHTAQGIGEVIVRDLGRLLEGSTPRPAGAQALPVFRGSILAGLSQSAWFVDTFVAEGFNVDVTRGKGRGVYDAALAVNGVGNWLAINKLAGGAPQTPYALPDGKPLTYDQLLTRRSSDPLFVDVATYTDYYRLRASISAQRPRRPGVIRYDWPAPHATSRVPPELVFETFNCNDGRVVPLNPLDYNPYLRTLTVTLARVVGHPGKGDRRRLPASALFALRPAPPSSPDTFNGLPGVQLAVPAVDPDSLQPIGGVRYPDAVVPLGRPTPVALPPVRFTTINDICGNFGGWQPFTAAELAARYTSVDNYLARYASALDPLIRGGYVAENERAGMLAAARAAYLAAPA
jgi:hypothetical protein